MFRMLWGCKGLYFTLRSSSFSVPLTLRKFTLPPNQSLPVMLFSRFQCSPQCDRSEAKSFLFINVKIIYHYLKTPLPWVKVVFQEQHLKLRPFFGLSCSKNNEQSILHLVVFGLVIWGGTLDKLL